MVEEPSAMSGQQADCRSSPAAFPFVTIDGVVVLESDGDS